MVWVRNPEDNRGRGKWHAVEVGESGERAGNGLCGFIHIRGRDTEWHEDNPPVDPHSVCLHCLRTGEKANRTKGG
jgi:hypothetical protein